MMRIGYLGEGHDLLGMMSVIGQYDHEYHGLCDHRLWPLTAKSSLQQQISLQRLVDYAKTLDLGLVIVPPAYEHLLIDSGLPVLPLYRDLIQQYVLPTSLVNKLGLTADSESDGLAVSGSITALSASYQPRPQQNSNAHYTAVPRVTTRVVSAMKYQMLIYSKDDWMMRKIWKTHLRHLKDAAVDTVLPTSYGLLYREKVLRHHLNWKKITIIGKKEIQQIFLDSTAGKEDTYSLTIHSTDPEGFKNTFLTNKKWRWLLERGKTVPVVFQKID